ncbi:MAG: response regulator, partial [Candidatus Riflebacteria bacterium]|nr:response regulator [Candidatus Riflebacteria bacterium]
MIRKVLVVDDEPVVLGAVCTALKRDALELLTANAAPEALRLVGAEPIDLIITDLMMPGMDGLQLLEELAKTGRKIPCIMITGYPRIQTALKAKRLGAFEYVTKPFTRDELRSVVLRALRLAELPPESLARDVEAAFVIPDHSWARVESDGTVTIGATRAMVCAMGTIEKIQCPADGTLLEQGHVGLALLADDGVTHSLHTPVGGVVLASNP